MKTMVEGRHGLAAFLSDQGGALPEIDSSELEMSYSWALPHGYMMFRSEVAEGYK